MNNIDISKVSVYSEFPPLVDYQDITIQFNIPSNTGSVPSPAGSNTTVIFDQTFSTQIDKSNGIADVKIHYTGMRAVGSPTGFASSAGISGGDYKDDISWVVKSTISDFTSALPSFMVSGKNVSNTQLLENPSVPVQNLSNPYYVINFYVWFQNGVVYCRAVLQRVSISLDVGYNYAWAGGTVTLTAKVSLLPY